METTIRNRRCGAYMGLKSALFWVALALFSASVVTVDAAQTTSGQPLPATQTKAHHFKHRTPSKPALVSSSRPGAPVSQSAPDWPINDKPEPASISWDSQGLRINAVNSSLQQILGEVASKTGTKVEGLNQDQRVFGVFGPGSPRDVLSQLLQGSGYNIVMVGDQGKGVPSSIFLTSRQTGSVPSARAAQQRTEEDDDVTMDNQVEPQPTPPAPAVFNPIPNGEGPVRTPQQLMQEIQQRQQQMQQQQGQPPGPPNQQ